MFTVYTSGGSAKWAPLLAALAFAAVLAAYRELKMRRGQSWPAVEGTIESATVEHRGGGDHQQTYASVFYSYAVEAEYYSGCYSRQAGGDGAAYRLLEPFHAGDKLLIHYKPSNVEESVPDRDSLEQLRSMPR